MTRKPMKEKLIELILSTPMPMCVGRQNGKRLLTAANIVDHLIAHDVTVHEWISVKDRLPDAGAIVLCNTKYFFEILQWDERADVWVDQYRSYRKNYVTHWMPLPEPPKGE